MQRAFVSVVLSKQTNLPLILRPVAIRDNILVGDNRDGGYFLPISVIANSKKLCGGGVSTSWHFEKKLKRLNPDIDVILFDGSISLGFFAKRLLNRPTASNIKIFIGFFLNFYLLRRFKFHKLWIKEEANDNASTDLQVFLKGADTILKIDIEGDEYQFLSNILEHGKGLNAIIIEFHDITRNMDAIVSFAEALANSHFISYTNANNYAGQNDLGECVELIFINNTFRDLVNDVRLANNPKEPIRPIVFK